MERKRRQINWEKAGARAKVAAGLVSIALLVGLGIETAKLGQETCENCKITAVSGDGFMFFGFMTADESGNILPNDPYGYAKDWGYVSKITPEGNQVQGVVIGQKK